MSITGLYGHACLYLRRHHLPVGAEIEDLLTVAAPFRTTAAAFRNLILRSRGRERLDVHLILPGFVRLVGDPLPIGRECALSFVEFRLQKRDWLLAARGSPWVRQQPQVSLRFPILIDIQQKPAVRRPVTRNSRGS